MNAVELLYTRLMLASSVDQNTSHQFLEKKRISPTPFMVKKQMKHQESVTANLQQLTSNPVPLLPKPALWFHLSWVEVITIPLIMIMFRFALHSFQLNLPLNLFHIKTPPRSSKFKMMKWTISWNSYTQSMMMIF